MSQLVLRVRNLEAWWKDAGERIEALAGGATLCRMGRDGATPSSVKYEEGRMAAFGEIRRRLERDRTIVLRWEVDRLAGAWAASRRAHLERRGASGGWVAYEDGRLDAARFVLERLDASGTP